MKMAVPIVAAALAVGAFEWGLRRFAHIAPALELDIYRKDQDGLLLLRPNIARRHVARQWDVEVRINSNGWRDAEREPDPGDYVVLGLGDSQAFGWGVELHETFFSIVEERLRRRRPTRIIKAAVPGASTVDQALLLERLAPKHRPNVVMLALFVGNDFTENGLGGADRFEVDEGLLTLRRRGGEDSGLGERPRRWIARRSHLAQLVRAVQFNLQRSTAASSGDRTWDAWMRDFVQIHLAKPDAAARRGIEETLQSLNRIVAVSEANSVEAFVLVVIPRSLQVYPEEAREMQDAFGVLEADLDLDAGQELLRDWRAAAETELDIRLVDPLPRFREAAKEGEALYFTPDAHLSPAGHALVAEAIASAAAPE